MPKPPIDYDILRRVSETASAFRYEDIWLLVKYDDAGSVVIEVRKEDPGPSDNYSCFHVSKVSYGPPPAVDVAVIGRNTTTVDLLRLPVPEGQMVPAGTYAADAVFWSQSAVEKFLIPYYASVYGDHADTVVKEVLNVLKPADSDNETAFAIAHLPGSEYVTLEEPLPNLYKIHRSGRVERIGGPGAGGG